MSDLHFLIPNLKIVLVTVTGWTTAVLLGDGYSNTITLGSILTAASVVVLGGLFTLRNNLKTFWKERALELEEKIRVQEQHADEKLQERAAFAEEQREIRHQLKTKLAAAEALIEVERAKHDLTAVTSRIDGMEELLVARQQMFEAMAAGVHQQSQLLTEILAELRRPAAQPIEGDPA